MRAVGAASTPSLPCGEGVRGWVGWGMGEVLTWPPEKPTATTPSSVDVERNLEGVVGGELMVKVVKGVGVGLIRDNGE